MNILDESLDGWWHAYFEAHADTSIGQGINALLDEPRGGWQVLDEFKESAPVPGAWHERHPGFAGIVWYHRPFVLPDDWRESVLTLLVIGICSQARIYLDEHLIKTCLDGKEECQVALGSLEPSKVYSLAICVWHFDDTGGITGSVTLKRDPNHLTMA
ncbi:MAG: hypothetical protein ACYC6L_09105 [Anaerolineae bacterium]